VAESQRQGPGRDTRREDPTSRFRTRVSFAEFPANLIVCGALARVPIVPLNNSNRGCNMDRAIGKHGCATLRAIAFCTALVLPQLVLAQSTSPFLTGANSLQTNILAWLTPVAIILIMVLGGMAMANRMSWGWCIGAILGVAIAFGAPQIVTWIRGMFGV
jgi:type IV secretory pathway VirB2 component (pilin)